MQTEDSDFDFGISSVDEPFETEDWVIDELEENIEFVPSVNDSDDQSIPGLQQQRDSDTIDQSTVLIYVLALISSMYKLSNKIL